jgi:hypothetical protein
MFWKSRHEREIARMMVQNRLDLEKMELAHAHALELEELRHRLARERCEGQETQEPSEEFQAFFDDLLRKYKKSDEDPG